MPKHKKQIKVVDYRSVNLAWLVDFKDKVFSRELASDIELVVAQEDVRIGTTFEIHQGDTLCVVGETATAYTVTRPYGDVRTGEIAKSTVASKPRDDWSTEEVAEYVIKRACLKDQCTYLELVEPKSAVSKTKYKGAFVSQARKCRFAELVSALEYFYLMKEVDLTNQYVWLDIFSANQPKLTARNVDASVRQQNEQQLSEGLHVAIAHFEERVLFMDKWDGAAALTRAWCVWEIFGVAKAKEQLQIALPKSEYERYIANVIQDFDGTMAKLAVVDVEKAECFARKDLEMIQMTIRNQSSYSHVNDIVMSQLRLWVASTVEKEIERQEAAKSPNAAAIVLLCSCCGLTYQNHGQYDRAELWLNKALRLSRKTHGPEHGETATCMSNFAQLAKDQGKFEEAETLMRNAMEISKKANGTENLHYAVTLANLAKVVRFLGKYEEAISLMREALSISTKLVGREHPVVAKRLGDLAMLLENQGKYEEAEKLLRESLDITRKNFGVEHPASVVQMNNLAMLLKVQRKYFEAVVLMLQVLSFEERLFGKLHPAYASDLDNYGVLLLEQMRFKQAEGPLREALAIRKQILGNKHRDVAQSLNNVATVLTHLGKFEEAVAMFEEAVRINALAFGGVHPDIARVCWNWADGLKRQGKRVEAKAKWEEACAIFKETLGAQHPTYQKCARWWSG